MTDPITATMPPSAKQHRLAHALFREAGIIDRDQRLAITSKIVGRHIDSSADLTFAEISLLIDELKKALGEEEP